jgi:O-antigen/teichoic acid export membrane protein
LATLNSRFHDLINRIFRAKTARWALIDQGISSGVSFLTGVLVARLLGPESFGVFALLFMAVLFFNSLQYATVISPMMSIAPQMEGDEQERFFKGNGHAALLLIGLSVGLTLLASVAIEWLKPEWGFMPYRWALLAAVVTAQLQEFYRRVLFTKARPRLAALSGAWRYLSQLAGLTLLYVYNLTDLNLILWLIAGSALLGAGFGHYRHPLLGWAPGDFKSAALRNWVSGRWILGSTILQWLTGNFFAVVAGAVVGPIAVGALRAAQQLLAPVQMITLAATNVIPVKAAAILQSDGVDAMNRFLQKMALIGGIGTAGLGIILSVAGDFWLTLVFGERFAGFGALMPWLSGALLLFYWELPLQAGLRALEETRPLFSGYVIAAMISVAFGHQLVGAAGVEGAAAGILFSHVIFAGTQLWGLRAASRRRNLSHPLNKALR